MVKSIRIFCAAVCSLAVMFICIGYAAISGSLNVTGNVSYKEVPYDGVVITNVRPVTWSNDVTIQEYKFSKPTNLQTSFTVNSYNTSVTFEITVKNNSDSTHWYQGVGAFPEYGSNQLVDARNGIAITTKDQNGSAAAFDTNDWLPPKESRTFYVTYHFGSAATGNISLMVKFDFGLRLASVQDGVLGLLNDPVAYAYLVEAFNKAYAESGRTVLGNVGEDKDIFDTLLGSNLTVNVDGVEKPVTIMMARENVDGQETGDSYPGINGPKGCEYTIYVTVDDLNSPGDQATVYAITYTSGDDGWYQIGQLYEGTSPVQDYEAGGEYEGAFDVANWKTVPNTTYTVFGISYTIVHTGGQDEYRCDTIGDLMSAKAVDFRNNLDKLQGQVTTICRTVYTYTKVGNDEIESLNMENQSKSGYAALKKAFDKIKPHLDIRNQGSAQFKPRENVTRAELISILVELEKAYNYYMEVN